MSTYCLSATGVNGAHQLGFDHLFHSTVQDYLALMQNNHTGTDLPNEIQVMFHEHNAKAVNRCKLGQNLANHVAL
jgi:hypothetical protein